MGNKMNDAVCGLAIIFLTFLPISTEKIPMPADMDSLRIFQGTQMSNVTAYQGTTAVLSCKVRHMEENSPASWIRLRDWHLLSHGSNMFTKDERFAVMKSSEMDWTLGIKFVNRDDEGIYVCQVSTPTGSVSHYYNLHVVVPRAYILGSEEYFAQTGAVISLVCIIEDTLEPPQYVFWYHNQRIIAYDTSRTRISFDAGSRTKKTSSRLMISSARRSDSGNYTCGASNTEQATVTVYVSDGEMRQFVRNNGVCLHKIFINQLITLFSTLYTIFSILC